MLRRPRRLYDVPMERDGPWMGLAKHYIRDVVFAANDGIITTFAVVAGARGAELDTLVVLALGFANLAADGLSMAVGNYLGIKSERAADLADGYREWSESKHALKHAGFTWLAFCMAGLLPLTPFLTPLGDGQAFPWAVVCTVLALFTVGALRTLVTRGRWWRSGLEMLLVGSLAGAAAFAAGYVVHML